MKVTFDITQSLLELSELEIAVPERNGTNLLSSPVIDERRKILQRGLNLEDAANSLLNFVQENGRALIGSKASISSDTALDLTLEESTTEITSVSDLSEISTGSFTINGVDFQIDTSTDSLEDIMDNINSSNAGVKASFDFSEGELVIESLRDKPMLLQNGSSNFLSATNLKDGLIAGERSIDLKEFLESESLQRKFSRFTSRFNKLMEVNFGQAQMQKFESGIQDLLREGIKTHFGTNLNTGTVQLGSNVELTINSLQTAFTKSKIAFTTDNTPSDFFNFLEASNGVLGTLASLSGQENEKLIDNINNDSTIGLLFQKKI